MPVLKITPRPSHERGHSDIGWLKSFHTFSVPGYVDPAHMQFGPLRIINEDRVDAHAGFPLHHHREFEIFSYIVDGELEHKDSMGNAEILKRGDIQLTSAGTGIRHSEHAHGETPVHFLQIWALPTTPNLPPKYFTRHFSDVEKKDHWVRVVAPVGFAEKREDGGSPAPVQSRLTLYAAIVSPGKEVVRRVGGRKAFVQVVQRSGYNSGPAKGAAVRVVEGSGGEHILREGDAAYVELDGGGAELEVANAGEIPAEVLLFDME
ncbi:Pirin domain-containing protein [Favolaschia claudopus]|uniref:Pirin domain-containing protein n=1 Tax=Favolaschia claudopus TaxID=2862362 RepID=A0AAW0CB42_9AGAR